MKPLQVTTLATDEVSISLTPPFLLYILGLRTDSIQRRIWYFCTHGKKNWFNWFTLYSDDGNVCHWCNLTVHGIFQCPIKVRQYWQGQTGNIRNIHKTWQTYYTALHEYRHMCTLLYNVNQKSDLNSSLHNCNTHLADNSLYTTQIYVQCGLLLTILTFKLFFLCKKTQTLLLCTSMYCSQQWWTQE